MSTSESVEDFRLRARTWLAQSMPALTPASWDRRAVGRREIERDLQRRLWDGGFAGICFPAEYGGLGLALEYQDAFSDESASYDMPFGFNLPTFSILAATLIDFGTHDQKLRHLPAILRGEELWVQFLSEPSGGSDLAGCLTRADRDGDVFILNGSKIWSSGAAESDYAMCLARTNWDVPKHRGLSMFILKIHQPGVKVEQIRQVDGSMEFCQEFFDDVVVPVTNVVGEIDDGWSVATRLLTHERSAVGGHSPYISGRSIGHDPSNDEDNTIVQLVKQLGLSRDPRTRELVAEAQVHQMVGQALIDRISRGITSGKAPPPSGSILKLFIATGVMRRTEIGLEIAGQGAAAWPVQEAHTPQQIMSEMSLWRQGMSLGGGSNEIQRNIISERVLGMPREYAADREIPYRDVKRTGG